MRLLYNNDNNVVNLKKANTEGTKYNVYFLDSISIENCRITFPKSQLRVDNINKIKINDNINYVANPEFSVVEVLKIYGIVISIYILVQVYFKISKKEHDISKEKAFLVLSIIIGIVLNIVIVPLSRYDDHAHFWRTYEIATGQIISKTSNKLPTSLSKLIIDEDGNYHINDITYEYAKEKLALKLDKETTEQFAVGGSAPYSPLNYIPQLIGVIIGKILNLNPLIIAYLGRTTNFISYILIIYIAIKLLPKEKWKDIYIVIATLPMCMNLAMSLSPDAVIISLTLLLIAYIMNIKFSRKIIGLKEIVIISLLTMIVAICKLVYVLFVLLMLLIPKDKFKNSKTRYLYFVLVTIITLGGCIAWKALTSDDIAISIHVNEMEQILFALSDPIRTINTFLNTASAYSSEFVFPMIGGWNTNRVIVVGFIIFMFISMFGKYNKNIEDDKLKFETKDKILVSIISFIVILLVFAGLYVGWTVATDTMVEGIQGRYFIPLLPILLIAFEKNIFKYEIKNRNMKYAYFAMILYIPVVIFSICSYM